MPIRNELTPCPDPTRYVLVRTKEGEFWRLKGGLKKPAILNARSHIFNTIITLLRRGFKQDGQLDVSVLSGLDLQQDYPLRKLLRGGFQWQHDKENRIFRFRISIPERNGAVIRRNKLMSGYRFIIILVHGNPKEEGSMQLKSVKSQDYTFAGTGVASECLLELAYTPEPGQWIFCLRAEALEKGKVSSHPGSKGLQILDGGKWE